MFLYPALTAGFLFVAVPLLVHLINMLRHRRQRWAAMDFLLASYRKQKNWIFLKQLLLLLTRVAIAVLLVAMLAGWVSGGRLLDLVATRTTHHLFVLDDSYSMGDTSGGATAYGRALASLRGLVDRLAASDGNHQITVIRSSRAALVTRAGSENADAAADLSARSIATDAAVINRVMGTGPSTLRTDLVPALDLASKLIAGTTADQQIVYVASDFRQLDWQSPQRAAEAIGELARGGATIRMVDCAATSANNLAITALTPQPDVWVAGVPVVVRATVKNYSATAATNVTLSARVIRYDPALATADPTLRVSGRSEALPSMVIEEIAGGGEETKSFQVFITQPGTHALEVAIADDALAIDNRRVCTLPLSELERVLVIDGDPRGRGAFHVASVLDPGGQVRTGALPDVQSPAVLRGMTPEQLARYRAVYLMDVAEINDTMANLLHDYVAAGGGLFWFLGNGIDRDLYNRTLAGSRRLLPGRLGERTELPVRSAEVSPDIILGRPHSLTGPLAPIGDAAFALVGVSQTWSLVADEAAAGEEEDPNRGPIRDVLMRRDGRPLVTQHDVGRGRVITALVGLDGQWTNWSGDPTFVVFLLQSNAYLWSAASPQVQQLVDDGIERALPEDAYAPQVTYLPPVAEPPRVPQQWPAVGQGAQRMITIDPKNEVISGSGDVDSLLQAGIAELVLTRLDGQSQLVPLAMVIQGGGGDLNRASPAEIQRAVEPVAVRFVSAGELAEASGGPSGSTTTLILLGLLALLLAAEQVLAYLSSYHPPLVAADSAARSGPLAALASVGPARRHQR
jgi:hypothetical protein